MKIGGLQKVSLIDCPGKISSCIFTQGCNFRCPFCHNPELVWPHLFGPPLDNKDVLFFLWRRRNQIESVVITGGEPTIQNGLVDFIIKVKEMGYYVKLDTNGSNPTVLGKLIEDNLIDYIAMDIKAPFEKYNSLCGIEVNLASIRESIEIIKSSSVSYEFRTTYVTSLLNEEDISKIRIFLGEKCSYKIQPFIERKEKSTTPTVV